MTSREFDDRLKERLEHWKIAAIGSQARAQLEAYYRLLARWNGSTSLTSLPLDGWHARAVDRLLIEPIQAAEHVADASVRWFDLGSGGGSPAIPLKILRPALTLTMVESKARKAAFLREAVRSLELSDTTVEAERFETLAGTSGMANVAQLVTARAVRADRALFDAVASLLSSSGRFFLFQAESASTQPRGGLELSATVELAGAGSALAIFRNVPRETKQTD